MGKSSKRLLVHKDIEDITTKDSFDIILTPQFYTLLKEELGIKFAYQARQIAPSLFDDYLDAQKEYQYYVYRCGSYWCFFAYNIEEIVSFLEQKGLKRHQIGKIFFAQELSDKIEDGAISISDNLALEPIDDIVTIFPKRLLDDDYNYKDLDLDKISFKNGISISSAYSSLIPLKQTIAVVGLLFILGGIFIAEGLMIRGSIGEDIEKLEVLLEKNPKLSSSRIRESILSQYIPIDKIERAKRDAIYKISKLLSSNNQLKMLSVDDKSVVAIIETTNINRLISNAKRKNLNVKKEGSKQVKVEVSL